MSMIPQCKLNLKPDGSFCFTELYYIYIETDRTHLDIDHAEHAGGPAMCTQRIMTTHLL